MRRKPVRGARSKVIIDVPTELATILKRHREIPWPRGRTGAVALCAAGGAGGSARVQERAD